MTNNRLPLTVQETTRALGVSDSTVRRMLAAGHLKEHSRDHSGRILIDPTSIDAAAVSLGHAELAGGEVRRELAPQMAALTQMAQTLADTLQRQEDRIAELSKELGEARAEARLLPARAEAAEQRAIALEQKLDQAREENTRLREELARKQPAGDYAPEQAVKGKDKQTGRGFLAWLLNRD